MGRLKARIWRVFEMQLGRPSLIRVRRPGVSLHSPFTKSQISLRACVHVLINEKGERSICRGEIAKDKPHGWLCAEHELMIQPRRVEHSS